MSRRGGPAAPCLTNTELTTKHLALAKQDCNIAVNNLCGHTDAHAMNRFCIKLQRDNNHGTKKSFFSEILFSRFAPAFRVHSFSCIEK